VADLRFKFKEFIFRTFGYATGMNLHLKPSVVKGAKVPRLKPSKEGPLEGPLRIPVSLLPVQAIPPVQQHVPQSSSKPSETDKAEGSSNRDRLAFPVCSAATHPSTSTCAFHLFPSDPSKFTRVNSSEGMGEAALRVWKQKFGESATQLSIMNYVSLSVP
jgi:hypothetical protein